ncbi:MULTISPECIES: DUF6445 family protein [unclassified Shewanella]|uniref:DUF6445 family protein n=1 Tax=unclassified Shewanella TaxID=196818 RepID=UPI0007EEE5D5|nr:MULTISPECIES: DUF6445 family protein [unclassified Shewanella]MBQ4889591.1 hypothetical protein [Shewanella sp. MMG014]OBT08344.1 hypothetical protein A9267_11625 [Shewanella sp. UCD-FRSSP16_17]
MHQINTELQIQVNPIPHSNHLVWVIDNFIADFDALVRYSKEKAYFNPVGADGTLFPGVRDEMPKPYYQSLSLLIDKLSQQPNGEQFKQHKIAKCWLSKVTLSPLQLNATQTMPHFDSLSAHDMAAVHYLNDQQLGGTNFYRYKGADTLHLSQDDKDIILKMVDEVKQAAVTRNGYINDSDELFEKVFSIEAKPNRLVIYSGNILHSANITNKVEFDKKAPNNRTSINSFFSVA